MLRRHNQADLFIALEHLDPNDHLCSIYDSQQEHFAMMSSTSIRLRLTAAPFAKISTMSLRNLSVANKQSVRWKCCWLAFASANRSSPCFASSETNYSGQYFANKQTEVQRVRSTLAQQ
jgi:hypothetical protein